MRIVQVITRSDSIGGAQLHVCELSKALVAAGHSVTVLVGGEGTYADYLRGQGIPCRMVKHLVRPVNPISDVLAVFELRRALRSLDPDLVCTHSSKAGFLGRLAARSLGLPATFTAHGWAFTEGASPGRQRLSLLLERLACRLGQRVIAVSEYDRRLAIDRRVLWPAQIVTIHNGIPDVRSELRADPSKNPPNLIMIARFEAPKEHQLLLRALAKVRHHPWTLHLVGDGPLRPAVQRVIAELDLRNRVVLWGARLDVAERLAESQVFLLVSNWEGLPLSILEAMRAGLPVIASRVGGVPELIREGKSGFLVPRGDVEDLAEKLEVLLCDPARRRRMGQFGRTLFETEFTRDAMLDATLRVYESIIHPERVRGRQIKPSE